MNERAPPRRRLSSDGTPPAVGAIVLFASSYCFEDFNLATDELEDVLC